MKEMVEKMMKENDESECDYTTSSRVECTEKCRPQSSRYINSNCCICNERNNGKNGGKNGPVQAGSGDVADEGNGDCAENVNCDGNNKRWDTRRCECVDIIRK